MSDWKEETNKRREFRQCPDDEDVTGSKPKKHCPKNFILECYQYARSYGFFKVKEGWDKRGSYKKLSDAEKAAEHLRLKDYLYKGCAFRIVDKNGNVLKEYPEIKTLQKEM
jgi:hypothetical protein